MDLVGSPPHGRGTPAGPRPQARPERLTPARAGNTTLGGGCSRRRGAHPRTGGEHPPERHQRVRVEGSPPHGRGTPVGEPDPEHQQRLTPARAGNTSAARAGRANPWAHPRTGGEHPDPGAAVTCTVGSPPHGRGTHRRGSRHLRPAGLTPARAGNTRSAAGRAGPRRAHPRTGGEHGGLYGRNCAHLGSPPHGRGTRVLHRRRVGRGGLTPARAGNTPPRSPTPCAAWAHPRTGGEHPDVPPTRVTAGGSPPHGRGTRRGARRATSGRGLTPARAGNTFATIPSSRSHMAHPRTGGEHRRSPRPPTAQRGSPPHGRGTRARSAVRGGRGGLTPARAGNTATPRATTPPGRAHPRTGGEHPECHIDRRWTSGSPPHGRGTQTAHRGDPPRQRLTPARAGNTASVGLSGAGCGAHPRTGGEHGCDLPTRGLGPGSPPHGRGTPGPVRPDHHVQGLTPARAGNTRTGNGRPILCKAHPRTGGEHPSDLDPDAASYGSPPHGRGTRRRAGRRGRDRRLTPARAGNTTRGLGPFCWGHGSPPHGRGTPAAHRRHSARERLTPARAGNTPSQGSPAGP